MATKNQVDSSVAERRLRPIYNWLDDGNNKKALQEADKVLKKQPNFQCAKVLKGLALLRLGKENECLQLLDTVRKELEGDDSTLQAMTICYREMNKPEIICDVYSTASKKDPNNEELLTHLFMAYVRICDYKKQQQTAMTLYKLKFKNHYYFWAVMSIVMQAHEAGPQLAKSLQLPLAEKMVKKFVEDNKIEAEQEVQLYIMILEMQNKLENVLEVIEGPLGEMLHSYIVVPIKRVEILVKMEYWKRANIEIKKMLMNNMDDWSLYLNYFKTVFHIVQAESNDNGISDESADTTINDSVKFLTDIQSKNQASDQRLRGPYLAILEFFLQLQDNKIDPELHFGYYTDLLLEYFRNFGSKTCCLNDLRPYLDKLSPLQVTTLLDEIWKFIELEDGQLPTSKEQMLRYISNLHITRYLGFHEKLSIKSKTQLADCLMRYYIHGAQFNGSPLLPTDIRQNDPFIILIVEIMIDIWLETNDACYIKHALVVLEHALEKSPSNHQFKLLLIKLYNILGISKGAQKIYELLDVKHVQLDSMGYLQLWPLISTGQYFSASHICEATLKFFTTNYKDSADHLTFLYKFGSFLKINEFIEFRERLNNSLHYSAVTVEQMMLEIFRSSSHRDSLALFELMSISPEKESIEFDRLEDNRDLDLCWTSDPKVRQLSDELVKITFQQDVDLLKIRSITLRILAGIIQLSRNSPNSSIVNGTGESNAEGKEGPHIILESLCQQLTSLRSSLSQSTHSVLPKSVINSPTASRLSYLIELPYLEILETLLKFILTIRGGDISEIDNISENNPITKYTEAISLFNTEFKSSDPTQLGLRCRILNLLTLLVEIGSVACLFCGACVDIARPRSHQVKKGKKKKDSSSLAQQSKEKGTSRELIVQRLLSLTASALQDLDNSLSFVKDKWREEENCDDVSILVGLLSLEDVGLSDFCRIQKAMSDSYQSSLSEMLYVIREKIKYLSELRL